MKGKILLLFICLNSLACHRYIIDQNGNAVPKRHNFELQYSIKNYKGDFLVDTIAIYDLIYTNIFLNEQHYDTTYRFQRFFPNGQYFISNFFMTKPTNEDYNNTSNGVIGYYTFVDSLIVIETFVSIDGGQYFYTEQIRTKTGLKDVREKVRCFGCLWTNQTAVYTLNKSVVLYAKPYW